MGLNFIFSTFVITYLFSSVLCEFVVPPITIKPFKQGGFAAYIADKPGIRMFAFHANVNRQIVQAETGNIFGDVIAKENGLWIFKNDNTKFVIGDKIYYWVFIQFEDFGYRKDGQMFEIKELLDKSDLKIIKQPPTEPPQTCSLTFTQFSGKSNICGGRDIFRDDFDSLNKDDWLPNVYMPKKPDHEFVSYENSPNVLYNSNNKLYIKPVLRTTERDKLRRTLDLTASCTVIPSEFADCIRVGRNYNYLPPIISSRVSSKFTLRYGTIEIRAKLPEGDWIYPQLYLEDVNEPNNKIMIAYCRGNKDLTGDNKKNIGSKMLFGGVTNSSIEPYRSKYLSSKQSETSFNKQFHTFKLKWLPDSITMYIDDDAFGVIEGSKIKFSNEARLILGVGVGGFTDFSDGFISGDYKKPWVNEEVKPLTNFFNAKDKWMKTWNGENVALVIDYIKIYAVKKQ